MYYKEIILFFQNFWLIKDVPASSLLVYSEEEKKFILYEKSYNCYQVKWVIVLLLKNISNNITNSLLTM